MALLTWLSVALSMPLWRTSPLGSGGRVRLWLSLAGAVAMLLGWALISAWHGGPAYADQLLWHQSVDRLGQTADHARPFWWYLPVLPALLFPWALWPQAWPFWRRSALIPTERPRLRRRRLPWIWAGALLLMFSMIGGKQIHYLMPMLPATALIIADTLHRRTQSATVTLRLIALSLAILALTIIALSLLQPEGSGAMVAPSAAVIMLLVAVALWLMRLSFRHGMMAVVLLAGVIPTLLLQWALAPLWPREDPGPPAAMLARLEQQGYPLAWLGHNYQATFQFAGRLSQSLDEIGDRPHQVCQWQQQHPAGWVIGDSDELPDTMTPPASLHRFPWRGHQLMILPAAPWCDISSGTVQHQQDDMP
ncbi:hypothetical protein [Kushneria phosphatilytica]|uniref:hypothetical protein n=1 Tax=Kushneria phosphatilytica TaxID=657387 RepID=UPI0008D984FA|nr:hypothetical protein [Kushneria phosphatilytica]OHV07611.1 hypothetical protein BH688_15495 [Kushneria phosphatilytica]